VRPRNHNPSFLHNERKLARTYKGETNERYCEVTAKRAFILCHRPAIQNAPLAWIIMVFYFESRCGEYTIYMGKDKYENEDLIKYGLPEDVWFHVDDLSSAHVYLRMKPGMSLDDVSDDLLLDCSAMVKANSIQGCKVGVLLQDL
jgi:predicted ribosome quality control (RQC) complex YloA/Tae2 family protein